MFKVVDRPIARRRKSKNDYEAIANGLKELPEGKAIQIDIWNGKIDNAPSNIYTAMKARKIECTVQIQDEKIFVSNKKK